MLHKIPVLAVLVDPNSILAPYVHIVTYLIVLVQVLNAPETVFRQNRESVAGSVIQATGTLEFEYGLWIGNHLKAQNGLQRVCTIPLIRPGAVRTPGFLRGQTEFQSA